MSVKILLSDPNKEWLEKTKEFLLKENYHVEVAANGKDCQLKLYKDKYFALILDIDTINNSGVEVLRYTQLNCPSVKIILTFHNEKRMEELNISKEMLSKLGISSYFTKPFPLKQLKDSIDGVTQYESWKNITASSNDESEEICDIPDEEFTHLPITSFYSGNSTIFDVYLRLRQNRYVKILNRGAVFEKKRLENYHKNKGVEYLYFQTKERGVYINFTNQLLDKITPLQNVEPEKKVATAKNLVEKYIEEVYTQGIRPQLIEEGKKISENIYNLIQKNPDLNQIMLRYHEQNPPAFAHMFLVSFMSTVICKNLEWATRRTIEMIAFGALLHDIGKLRFPERMREKKKEDYDAEDWKFYKKHPEYGIEMLDNINEIPVAVKQIIYQHHECVNKSGFPNQLSGMKIYPLAKVVNVANAYCNLFTEKKITPLEGLKEFVLDRNEMQKYEPDIIRALLKGFTKN